MKEYNTEGVNEPRTLDTSVRKPYGTAEGVLVEVLPPSVQNIFPGHGVVFRLGDIADQRLSGSENHEQIIIVEGATFIILCQFYCNNCSNSKLLGMVLYKEIDGYCSGYFLHSSGDSEVKPPLNWHYPGSGVSKTPCTLKGR